jgi:cyclohexa-1,5-dienecarbonyl-CoA hydratase
MAPAEPAAARPGLRYARDGRIARIVLDRPPVNVLDRPLIRALEEAVVRAGREGATVLVLESADPRTFSAGVSVGDHDPAVVAETLRVFHGLFRRLYDAPFVTVAKVRGRCLGGGCELALFCDMVIAADTASFAFPEISLACFPPVAVSAFPYRFGRAAVELIVSGEPVDGEVALRAGLVSRYVPRDELDQHVDELAANLAAKSAPVLSMTIRLARQLWSPGFRRALDDAERSYLEDLVRLPDYREGLAAFTEKRAPRFTHDGGAK